MTASATALPLPAARFTDLLAAEWIKIRSLRSIHWALGAGALGIIAFNTNAARADYVGYPHYGPLVQTHFLSWALRDAFTQGAAMMLLLVASSIGAICIVGEYSTGLVRTTFAAVPDRRALMSAKVVVVTAVMTVYGAFTAGASFILTQAVLDGRGQGVSIGHPGALRVVVASALLAPVCALAGLGLGALLRHSATTTVVDVFVLLFLPTFVTERYHWTACVKNALPFNAWYRLVDVEYGHQPFTLTPRYPTTVTGGWIVFGAWALAAAVVAVVAVDRRDV
ncbi:ABC transporter permease [Streptomyces sp. NPDC004096]